MSAATKTRRGNPPPPARGKPYYDVDAGRKMVVPKGGGRAIPYIEGGQEFSARRALRRAGIRTGTATVRAGDRAAARTTGGLLDFGQTTYAATGAPGVGGLLVWAFATIIGLALIENMLGGRGPAGVQTIFNTLGQGISKLVSPNDPLIPRGVVGSSTPTLTGSGGTALAKVTGASTTAPGLGPQSGYVLPVPGAKVNRLDQGLDMQGTPGQSVVAIGDAKVDAVKSDLGGFGVAIYYTLLNGPYAGQQIYVGHAKADVRPGARVKAGDPIATLLQHPLGNATQPGWVEIGFAKSGQPVSHSVSDTKSAQVFKAFLVAIGLKGGS